MKVTESSTFRLMQTNLDRVTNKLHDLRVQGATGYKLNKPSDDPASIRPVLTTRTQIRQSDRYIETMGQSVDKMGAADGYLGNVENILVRVKEIAINAVNGAMSNSDLNVLADEIAQIREELLDSANAVVDGKYIFAGYEEDTKPFVENPNYNPDPLVPFPPPYDPTDSTTWPYLYMGDANTIELEITPGEFTDVNITGNELFLGVSNANWIDSTTPAAGVQPEPGKIDIFAVLVRTEEAIRANNVDDPTGPGGSIQSQIENLEIAADQNRRIRSRMGNRAHRIDTARLQQEDAKIDLEQILSRYQDADAIETFNDIVQQETAFQAALNITSRVSQISILDYM